MKKNNNSTNGNIVGATAGIATGALSGVAASFAFAENAQASELETDELEIIPEPNEEATVVVEQTYVQATPKTVEPHVEEVHENDSEVEVLGYETITDGEGNHVDVAAVTVDGAAGLVIDVDQDGIADVLAYDENRNGFFEDDEFHDVENENISMRPLYVAAQNSETVEPAPVYTHADPILDDPCTQDIAYEDSDDMPDYINDADVDSFLG